MKHLLFLLCISIHTLSISQIQKRMTYNKLNEEEQSVILNKGTERPFTGKYDKHFEAGTYLCKQCNSPLYKSTYKFDSGCGWPAFDDALEGAVKQLPDADGRRTEIVCANCGGHLGHVFTGEGLTPKNTRHCVNSISMVFEPQIFTDNAVFAAGCFWGVEYYFKKLDGVIAVTSGYIGGHVDNPFYEEVCTGKTGHAEAVEVVYDTRAIDFEKLTRYFFEIHNFEQTNGQGPDLGPQYRSAIFYKNDIEKEMASEIIEILKSKGYKVATKLEKASTFWKAEKYHQDYYNTKGTLPYCHSYKKVF